MQGLEGPGRWTRTSSRALFAALMIWTELYSGLIMARAIHAREDHELHRVFDDARRDPSHTSSNFCGIALKRGRRRSMEDRAVCFPDLCSIQAVDFDHCNFQRGRTPLDETGEAISSDTSCGLDLVTDGAAASLQYAAVFDGHEGAGASSLAVRCLHHILVDEISKGAAEEARRGLGRPSGEVARSVISAAVHRAVPRLDSLFQIHGGPEAVDGSTAVVAISINDWLLVSHVGDSPAFMCSVKGGGSATSAGRNPSSRRRHRGFRMTSEPLTRDHRPDDPDERARIERAGGRVERSGSRWRVQRELLVSRAIGARPYRSLAAPLAPLKTPPSDASRAERAPAPLKIPPSDASRAERAPAPLKIPPSDASKAERLPPQDPTHPMPAGQRASPQDPTI
ncbi:hypothetical protein CYMTET_20036 [Cymbomonas tetramitiformis]|uniref:PPM-type phosphatase domain-containing protein n=1 Tax=Cymbomonas tetramitiformis TaxID=36881 RepID=A0AAE0G4V4_9CHLO|nr:hypothetical protein CYMTET_20036 [Cymbomonas tetramitiformis]